MSFDKSLARSFKMGSSRVAGLTAPGAGLGSGPRVRCVAWPWNETRWSSRSNSRTMVATPAWTSSMSTSGASPRGSLNEIHADPDVIRHASLHRRRHRAGDSVLGAHRAGALLDGSGIAAQTVHAFWAWGRNRMKRGPLTAG